MRKIMIVCFGSACGPPHQDHLTFMSNPPWISQDAPGFIPGNTDPRYMLEREFALKNCADDPLFQLVVARHDRCLTVCFLPCANTVVPHNGHTVHHTVHLFFHAFPTLLQLGIMVTMVPGRMLSSHSSSALETRQDGDADRCADPQ